MNALLGIGSLAVFIGAVMLYFGFKDRQRNSASLGTVAVTAGIVLMGYGLC